MTGVLLQVKKGELRAVATDGHRLVRINYSGIKQPGITKDIIIPAKALNLVARSGEEGAHTMALDSTHIQFSFGNTTLTSRLIEETYPNYESVIPLDNEKKLIVNREVLLASVRRVALYSSSTTHQVRFSLKKNEMRIAAEDIDFGGEAKEKIKCEYDGEEMEIGFNSHYIVDILSHIDGEDVVFKLSSPVRAAIVAPGSQKEGEDLLMLVMPVRLNA
jgi:DNA polymerase-3 subunit beta